MDRQCHALDGDLALSYCAESYRWGMGHWESLGTQLDAGMAPSKGGEGCYAGSGLACQPSSLSAGEEHPLWRAQAATGKPGQRGPCGRFHIPLLWLRTRSLHS